MNQRQKGNRGERLACQVVGKWTGIKFAKVPASGGLHWNLTQACGDIICLKENHWFPFSIEVKNYGDINFAHLIMDNQNVDIIKFWTQCKEDAKEAKKLPLLLMRYNGLPKNFFFVVIDLKIWKLIFKELDGFKYIKEVDYMISKTKGYKITILRSDQFFKIPYSELRTHLKVFKAKKK